MRILVTGGSGRLGSALLDRLMRDGRHEVLAWSGTTDGARGAVAFRPVELTDSRRVAEALEESDPDAVIHAGALSSAEAVHRDPARGRAVNVEATRRLADWAASRGRRLVFTSTDLVFDGSRSWYREDDEARPVLGYGRTKLEAEAHVVATPGGLVARLSLLYGPNPSGRPGFFDLAIEALRRGEPRPFFRDEFRTPLDYRTAADALVQLAESGAVGIVHVGGRERLSRYELMRRAAVVLAIDPDLVRPGSQVDAILPEPRPADASLDTSRLAALCPALERPSVEAALGAPHSMTRPSTRRPDGTATTNSLYNGYPPRRPPEHPQDLSSHHRYSRVIQGFREIGDAWPVHRRIPKNSRTGPAYVVMTLISLRAGEQHGLADS